MENFYILTERAQKVGYFGFSASTQSIGFSLMQDKTEAHYKLILQKLKGRA